MRTYDTSGHGLVVEHLLAKQKAGVRFSLAAQKQQKAPIRAFCVPVDKGVSTGDKRQKTRPIQYKTSVK